MPVCEPSIAITQLSVGVTAAERITAQYLAGSPAFRAMSAKGIQIRPPEASDMADGVQFVAAMSLRASPAREGYALHHAQLVVNPDAFARRMGQRTGRRLEWVLWHEFGHYVDSVFSDKPAGVGLLFEHGKCSKNPTIAKELRAAQAFLLNPSAVVEEAEQIEPRHGKNSPPELFAQAFACAMVAPAVLERNAPRLASAMRDLGVFGIAVTAEMR
jgi:hypothetical protein